MSMFLKEEKKIKEKTQHLEDSCPPGVNIAASILNYFETF